MILESDLVASTPGIAEGPCWVGGEVWFTDQDKGLFITRFTRPLKELLRESGPGSSGP